jgi:hypothetical protein
MDLWRARVEALAYLAEVRPTNVATLDDLFSHIDLCIDAYESTASTDTYGRICGLTLLKAKNLGVGAYSLILDGLGQEAGALVRPMIEYAELLTYFRMFPAMVDRAAENDLPSAGKRAKAIRGIYQEFRGYLNAHACHSSYSHYSLSHLLNGDSLRFRKLQVTVPAVLERNVADFAIQLYLLLHEGALGLERLELANYAEIADAVDSMKVKIVSVFVEKIGTDLDAAGSGMPPL